MELLRNLFMGFPEFWGGGVAHSVLILSLVIAIGLLLGKVKVNHISLGMAWVLIVGIIFGHFNLNLDEHLLHFLKEFGLIAFVFAIGLQVGPGFFSSFRRGGLKLNTLMAIVVLVSVVVTVIIHFSTGISMTTMAGIFAGAVTNTPALGAAQQATTDLHGIDAPEIAMGYAVTYPMGVIGVILSFLILRYILRINLKKEEHNALHGYDNMEEISVRNLVIEVTNDMIDGRMLRDIRYFIKRNFIISRVIFAGSEDSSIVSGNTIIHKGDRLMVVTTPKDEDSIAALFGKIVDFNWNEYDENLSARRIPVTRFDVNGKRIKDLKIRSKFDANITRVSRGGVDYVASPDFQLHTGDLLTVVGSTLALTHTESELNTANNKISYPNLIPMFIGIALGCILAHIPFIIPGVPQPVKFGLAAGPMIIAILIGYFGRKHNWISYNTMSSNMMLREIGITIFLACVGLGAGKDFINTIVTSNGLMWAVYGLMITMIPVLVGGIIGRCVFHLNYFTMLGVLSGGNTNPPALAYANEYTTTDSPALGYSMVYPVAMILRVIIIQILIMTLS